MPRARPALFKQLMGNLPADRVTPARPFITTGVDYFGPIWVHHKIRRKRPDKAYIAVFRCFATKAVHMEVVSNLSTEAFIGALRRKSFSPNVIEGMLVIIKEDHAPVLQWPSGRIIKIYKGDDGHIRVCDIKTARGTFKRPIHKLAPLFNDLHIEYPEYNNSTAQKRQHSAEADTLQSKRKIVSYASQGLFSTIIISLIMLLIILASPINITKFPSDPGLYFEGIGSTKTWDNLIQESDLLTPRRSRIGALDIVGNVAHALFGVLDSEYAKQMAQTIVNVKQNEDDLLLLLKTQASAIDSTINIIKQDQN
ncbi:hypothetical protein EVAR_63665_1 [Eumeta japonica]|uniref:DUF5641 domain-containing protein n=1 Tax=Eumeta variegata TaxID=151549 RepID=A0A4C2A9Y8_EUMVA|nr:hypothetical protein EVAR_63665_1 [Eumeta japonica]